MLLTSRMAVVRADRSSRISQVQTTPLNVATLKKLPFTETGSPEPSCSNGGRSVIRDNCGFAGLLNSKITYSNFPEFVFTTRLIEPGSVQGFATNMLASKVSKPHIVSSFVIFRIRKMSFDF